MGRFAGRNGRIYLGIGAGEAVVFLNFMASWEINFPSEKYNVTAMGDENQVTVSGLPNATGSFTGWMDDSSGQHYQAAVDGVARKFYLYPSFTTRSDTYFWGTINVDASFSGGVDGAGTASGNWEAATTISRHPTP